ncbi:geranylgeranyl diphosphate synthase type I [Motilibacter peucedani]|uniref:Geranylgeranyl diphosphate synthase type I n=1 Tax=Motilibacter peucedani TaxID=598650 RepID=A0A420XJX2_9ACTN|nr:polyprenyl synthetase family protein [Motilibacter peucedani]RKS67989.1 geranylgeranyl diphosphate synthase type I [Motilibacter peucedani]
MITARAQETVLPTLRRAVASMSPQSARLCAYHLGWAEVDGTPREGGGGKALRPALALLSAEAVGAPASTALPGAAAVELVHNFSLLHDDVMDGDVERRHRPTVWALEGAPAAILAGDEMLSAAYEALLDAASPHAPAAMRLLASATRELIRGQYDDVAFESRGSVTLEECLAMARGKTAALISASSAIGAVLAGAPPRSVDALSRFGDSVGLAFQLVDDLLGIWGDPQVTGKAVGADLHARKKTLPVTYALSSAGPEAAELAALVSAGGPLDAEQVARASDLVEAAGARAWAGELVDELLERAEQALDEPGLEAGPCAELVALARFVGSRDH